MATRRTPTPTTNSSGVTLNEAESTITCGCGVRARIFTAKTKNNAGRRFYGCGNFGGSCCCDFFMWFDPKIPEGARDMIVELIERNQTLSESSQSRRVEVDVNSLIDELKTQKAKYRRLKVEIAQMKKRKNLFKWAFVLCICYNVMSIVCNLKVSEKFPSLP